MEWIKLFTDLGIFTIAGGFITYLLNNSSNRKLESYKSELEQESKNFQSVLDAKLESYKSELNIKSYKSTKVYEQQLSAIVTLYGYLSELNTSMLILTSAIKPGGSDFDADENKRIDAAANAYNTFNSFFNKNIIFFPDNLVSKIQLLRTEYTSSYTKHTLAFRMKSNSKNTFDEMISASEKVSGEIQDILKQIILDFKNLIGVEE